MTPVRFGRPRVSNKVSKITSRHLVPLDRAFPAHALLHESSRAHTMPPDREATGESVPDASIGLRLTSETTPYFNEIGRMRKWQ